MATRLYMPFQQTAPPVTVTKNASWNSEAANVLRQPLLTSVPAVDSVSGEYYFTVSEADPAIHDQMCAQFISPPMTAQTITGSLSGIWSPREAASTYDFGTQVVLRVVNYYGTVVRGTLIDPFPYTTTVATQGVGNREFPSAGSHITRFLPGGNGNITTLAVQLGDRLVWEIGARACNLVATTRTADPRLQLKTGWTDGAWAEGTTGTSFNHWIEFTDTLTFDPTYTPGGGTTSFTGWGVPI